MGKKNSLGITDPSLSETKTNTWLDRTTPGTGKIAVFQNGPNILDINAEGRYTVVVKRASDLLAPLNVVALWTIGPDSTTPPERLVIDEAPWVLEWTVEAARTPIEISVAKVFGDGKIYNSDWSRLVFATAQQGSGSVEVFEIGEFAFNFEGEGQYTVTIKTK